MVDKATFLATLDGTLEDKIYSAFYYGYERGHLAAMCQGHPGGAGDENWEINIAYDEWKEWLADGSTNEDWTQWTMKLSTEKENG